MTFGGKDIRAVIGVILAALLSGCGSPAPPGTWGSAETNTLVSAEVTLGAVDLCSPLDSEASVDIQTEAINENLPENTLYLEGYDLEFRPLSSGAPPIEGISASESRELPVSSLKLLFLDSGRKAKYLKDVTSGGYDAGGAVYTAEYTFHGKDIHGEEFGAVAKSTFSIARYAGCEALAISPVSITVTGLPDEVGQNDPSDDVILSVRGGLPPYTVSSSGDTVVHYPDTVDGAGTFRVEPEAVASEATVDITVTDSAGASVVASLTMKAQDASGTLSVSPGAVSLTGVANPDADTSDDITFHISGGTGPYTVYSDNTGVIPAPSVNPDGTFDVDPGSVADTEVITLTVVDSMGASAAVKVTVSAIGASGTLSVSPGAVSLTGVANPDTDTSDDITFHISGGTGPYTVYSDNTGVIPAPSVNPDGTFDVDPGSVLTETTIILTVVDSTGGSFALEVKVTQ